MLLEAALQEPAPPGERDALLAFTAEVESRLDALAASLRDGQPPAFASLRGEERALAALLGADGDDASAHRAAIAESLDRITDSLDSLARLLGAPAGRADA